MESLGARSYCVKLATNFRRVDASGAVSNSEWYPSYQAKKMTAWSWLKLVDLTAMGRSEFWSASLRTIQTADLFNRPVQMLL